MTQLTELLGRIHAGDLQARDTLFATAYSELHRLAPALRPLPEQQQNAAFEVYRD